MGTPLYPIDLIAIRDARVKMATTVIKSWNVNYIIPEPDTPLIRDPEEVRADELARKAAEFAASSPAPEPEEELSEEQKALIAQANEVFARLEAEKAADEAVKQAEIDAAFAAQGAAEAVAVTDADYNAATGSYSGAYGKGPVDDSTRDIAASILGERNDAFSEMLQGLTG